MIEFVCGIGLIWLGAIIGGWSSRAAIRMSTTTIEDQARTIEMLNDECVELTKEIEATR